MALIWAWRVDGFKPGRYDVIGALVALPGACIIIFTPGANKYQPIQNYFLIVYANQISGISPRITAKKNNIIKSN